MSKKQLTIYTDGACKGNPGIGGWSAILIYGKHSKELYGATPTTTNNRMELTAVIEALKAITRPCSIAIFTDSQYVQKGMTEWLPTWLKKNWKNVKNPDLWQELVSLSQAHIITWNWVRGHNGDALNERADLLANLAIVEFMQQHD